MARVQRKIHNFVGSLLVPLNLLTQLLQAVHTPSKCNKGKLMRLLMQNWNLHYSGHNISTEN